MNSVRRLINSSRLSDNQQFNSVNFEAFRCIQFNLARLFVLSIKSSSLDNLRISLSCSFSIVKSVKPFTVFLARLLSAKLLIANFEQLENFDDCVNIINIQQLEMFSLAA